MGDEVIWDITRSKEGGSWRVDSLVWDLGIVFGDDMLQTREWNWSGEQSNYRIVQTISNVKSSIKMDNGYYQKDKFLLSKFLLSKR